MKFYRYGEGRQYARWAVLFVIDVRVIQLSKYGEQLTIPFESNLLVLNMMAFVILSEKLYDMEFIEYPRCVGFEEYKESILNDPFANLYI